MNAHLRVQWCKTHENWSKEMWGKKVIWSDQLAFTMFNQWANAFVAYTKGTDRPECFNILFRFNIRQDSIWSKLLLPSASYRLQTCYTSLLAHSSFTDCQSSLRFEGCLFPAAALRFLHKCSMKFRFRLPADHFRTVHCFLQNHSQVLFNMFWVTGMGHWA